MSILSRGNSIYNFFGIKINTKKQEKIQKILTHLKTIIDTADIKKIKEEDNEILYEIIAKKDNFTKTFFMSLDPFDKEIMKVYIEKHNINTHYPISIETALLSIGDEILISKNEEIKKIMNIIRCTDNKCPICGSKMQKETISFVAKYYNLICLNGCYNVKRRKLIENENNLITTSRIFGRESELDTYNDIYFANIKVRLDVQKTHKERIEKIFLFDREINYWKENDRYLSKILGGK